MGAVLLLAIFFSYLGIEFWVYTKRAKDTITVHQFKTKSYRYKRFRY